MAVRDVHSPSFSLARWPRRGSRRARGGAVVRVDESAALGVLVRLVQCVDIVLATVTFGAAVGGRSPSSPGWPQMGTSQCKPGL